MSLTTIDFSRFKLKPGDKVLDLGCGEGRHAITAYLDVGGRLVVSGAELAFHLGSALRRMLEGKHEDADFVEAAEASVEDQMSLGLPELETGRDPCLSANST